MPFETAHESLGILLLSGEHERAHFAFMMASGAAAMGRPVVMFATNGGCRALAEDWSALAGAGRDAAIRLRGVAGIGELRDASRELGVRMIACEAGMRISSLESSELSPGVEVGGVAAFLEAAKGGQILSL